MKYFLDDKEITFEQLTKNLTDWVSNESDSCSEIITLDAIENDEMHFSKSIFDWY